MTDIEEKYDLMKRDLDKAVKEADNLNEICYRLERENSDYHFENMKLKKQLAIAVEGLKDIYEWADDEFKATDMAKEALEQIKELDK